MLFACLKDALSILLSWDPEHLYFTQAQSPVFSWKSYGHITAFKYTITSEHPSPSRRDEGHFNTPE